MTWAYIMWMFEKLSCWTKRCSRGNWKKVDPHWCIRSGEAKPQGLQPKNSCLTTHELKQADNYLYSVIQTANFNELRILKTKSAFLMRFITTVLIFIRYFCSVLLCAWSKLQVYSNLLVVGTECSVYNYANVCLTKLIHEKFITVPDLEALFCVPSGNCYLPEMFWIFSRLLPELG